MALKIVTVFMRGRTAPIRSYVYNEDGNLTDPTAITISIIDDDGTERVSDAAMTYVAKGIYDYFYNIPSNAPTGQWLYEVLVTEGSGENAKTFPDNGSFTVTRSIRE